MRTALGIALTIACLATDASARVVQTAAGAVEGTTAESGVRIYRGIPFAAPPIGDRRWRLPEPAASWEGVRPAREFGPRCPQRPIFGDMVFRSDGMGEDCLYLNVWVPPAAAGDGLPVLLYFYGGGFLAGDGSEPRYDGESMARRGIVAVTSNYRLGALGFLAHPELSKESPRGASGNYGLLDQALALRWVAENISAFGGDPRRITIAGESAGSISVSAHLASPLSKDRIAGALGESGSLFGALSPLPLAEAEALGSELAAELGAVSLAELRALTVGELLDAASRPGPPRFGPAIDGYFLARHPLEVYEAGEHADVPLLVGWNSLEMPYQFLLGPRPATPESFAAAVRGLYGERADEVLAVYPSATPAAALRSATDLAGDRFIAYSTWKWSELHRRSGKAPVYRYLFAWPRPPANGAPEGTGRAGGALHSAEIEYALGNLDSNEVYAWTAEDREVSERMQASFASFIATGDPNGAGLPEWPALPSAGDETASVLVFEPRPRIETESHRERYLLLDRLAAEPPPAPPAAASEAVTGEAEDTGEDLPQLGEADLDDVIAAMTTEEKVKLLVGMGMRDVPGIPMDPADAAIPDRVPGAAGRTHAIPRLGIPSLTLADGPAGLRIEPEREGVEGRTFHATAFPVATLVASSWDPELAREIGVAMGGETRDYGVDVLLAPGLNIHRNPLGGRSFEYYSEDPLLSGRMAGAFVDGVESQGVGATLKHFVANNQEFNRMQLDTSIGQRALREIYLRGFRIAVRSAQPWAVMSSYNLINGIPASESRELLTTVLRDEWGFAGVVMTDWFAGADPVAQMNAGNDIIMPGLPDQAKTIVAAVADGRLGDEQLDTNVRRTLEMVLRSPTFRGHRYSDRPDLGAHAELARRAAAEGMVLLENRDRTLPLRAGAKVAMFGNASYDPFLGGTGSGDVNEAYSVSPYAGLERGGFSPRAELRELYEPWIAERKAERPPLPMPFLLPDPIPELVPEAEVVAKAAAAADVAIVTLGRNSGEFEDREVEDDFTLTERERELLQAVSASFHDAGKRVVVVLNVGGVVETASWTGLADAVLLAWQPGQEAGHAVADVLSGRVNPSGRLPMTFPVLYADVPSAGTFPGRVQPGHEGDPAGIFGVPSEVAYGEGIYVGYRYYDSFGVEPAYEFGFGRSYTRFEYGELSLSDAELGESITAEVTVTNAGEVAGREVVQLYVAAPGRALDKPASELRAFAKTALLAPGGSEKVTFTLTAADLASFDPARSAWVAEAGDYQVRVGASSRDVRANKSFRQAEERMIGRAHDVLPPPGSLVEREPPAEE